MTRNSYPSDVCDEEWVFVAAYLTLMREDAPQREYALRQVFNGSWYIAKSGGQWRMMPNDLPPWPDIGLYVFPHGLPYMELHIAHAGQNGSEIDVPDESKCFTHYPCQRSSAFTEISHPILPSYCQAETQQWKSA